MENHLLLELLLQANMECEEGETSYPWSELGILEVYLLFNDALAPIPGGKAIRDKQRTLLLHAPHITSIGRKNT